MRRVLEKLNREAKKVGLHVAEAKKDDRYTVRKIKNGKLVAKNIKKDEIEGVIKEHS